VRVINAAVNSGLTLWVDGTQAVSGVTFGTASSYSGVSPMAASLTGNIQLIGGGYTGPSFSHDLVTGSVYTFFLYDATLPPLVIRDR